MSHTRAHTFAANIFQVIIQFVFISQLRWIHSTVCRCGEHMLLRKNDDYLLLPSSRATLFNANIIKYRRLNYAHWPNYFPTLITSPFSSHLVKFLMLLHRVSLQRVFWDESFRHTHFVISFLFIEPKLFRTLCNFCWFLIRFLYVHKQSWYCKSAENLNGGHKSL